MKLKKKAVSQMFEIHKIIYYPFVASKIFVRERCMKRELKNKDIEGVVDALIKKAVGYSIEEVLEEYTVVDNELVLSKKKKSIKDYPPDLSAIKLVLENMDNLNEFSKLSREELLEEKERLLRELKEIKEK